MNLVVLSGNIGVDPELKQAKTTSLVNVSIAITYGKDTTWVRVTAFGKTAEFLCKYFKKGSSIEVKGYLNASSYEKDGKMVSSLGVVATEVGFCPSGGKRSSNTDDQQKSNTDYGDREMPF
jgi:single-strand DNA-binding protein